MDDGDRGCGPVFAFYAAARDGDLDTARTRWPDVRDHVARLDSGLLDRLAAAESSGSTDEVATRTAGLLFAGAESPSLRGPAPAALGALLYWFGYVASFVLFFHARSRESVVRRLRWAYRVVGVDIRDTETVDGVERTVFWCPYRNVGASRFGPRRVCHDVLDRVDDGYVSFLERHRGLDYDRPRACGASECCYSEVAEL